MFRSTLHKVRKITRKGAVRLATKAGLPARPPRRLQDGAWQAVFDERLYGALNPHRRDDELDPHFFATKGFVAFDSISVDRPFDPAFYKATYVDISHFDDVDAYRHWLVYGLNEDRFASPVEHLRRFHFPGDRVPPFFRQSLSSTILPGSVTDSARLQAFLALPSARISELLITHGIENFDLSFVYLYFVRLGDREKAAVCLQHYLLAHPTDKAALHHFGDLKLAQGDKFAAFLAFAKLLETNPGEFWPSLRTSEILIDFGRTKEAVDHALDLFHRKPESWLARRNLVETIRKRFHLQYGRSLLTASTDRAEARRALNSAVAELNESIVSARLPALSGHNKVNRAVAIVSFSSPPQCFRYRVEHRIAQLELLGWNCEWFDASDPKAFSRSAQRFSVAIFSRVPGTPEMLLTIDYASQLGLRTFYDIDDLIVDEENYPPPLDGMGGLVTPDEYAGLSLDPVLYKAAARSCEFGIGSTNVISRELRKLVKSGTAITHRNGFLDRDYLGRVRRHKKTPDTVTVFYGSGSRSHTGAFLGGAGRALRLLMARDPRIVLHIVGELALDESFAGLLSRIRRTPMVASFSDYLDLLSSADINIAPLDSSVFSDAKSEIKWMEAALVGVPSVVARSANYLDVVSHGQDCLVCSSWKDWSDAIERLAGDAELRDRLATSARNKVLATYSARQLGTELVRQFDALLDDAPRHAHEPKTKLAVVNVFFSPLSVGGATRVAEELARELASPEYNTEIEVFTVLLNAESEGVVERFGALGFDITAVAPSSSTGLGVPENDIATRAAFSEFLTRFKPDVVHFHCVQLLTASLLDEAASRNIPTVVTVHDGWWISDHQFLIGPNGRLVSETGDWGDSNRLSRLRRALRQVGCVVAVSNRFAELYEQRGIGPLSVIPNPITDLIVPEPPSDGRLAVGFLGGFGLAKGGDLIRKAISAVSFPNLRFLFVDHAAPEGDERVERWGPNEVLVVGKVAHARVGDLYARLNVVLAPSVCVESFGLVVREAITLGRWVVVSDRGALSESVEEGQNGFVIDVANAGGLILVLRRMDSAPERFRRHDRTRLGLPGVAEVAKAYQSLFAGLMAEAGRPTTTSPHAG